MTVLQIYEETIKPLPVDERLQLATLILTGITPPVAEDYREEWSDDDYRDFSRATWQHVHRRLAEAGDA